MLPPPQSVERPWGANFHSERKRYSEEGKIGKLIGGQDEGRWRDEKRKRIWLGKDKLTDKVG